jgi:hypothetical protein
LKSSSVTSEGGAEEESGRRDAIPNVLLSLDSQKAARFRRFKFSVTFCPFLVLLLNFSPSFSLSFSFSLSLSLSFSSLSFSNLSLSILSLSSALPKELPKELPGPEEEAETEQEEARVDS